MWNWFKRKKKKKNANLIDYIALLFELSDNLQINFFRENGLIILQVFKGNTVKNWGEKLPKLKSDNQLVFCLHFNDGKTNNVYNYERFKTSKWNDLFIEVKDEGWLGYVSDSDSVTQVHEMISNIIKDIYDLEEFTFETIKTNNLERTYFEFDNDIFINKTFSEKLYIILEFIENEPKFKEFNFGINLFNKRVCLFQITKRTLQYNITDNEFGFLIHLPFDKYFIETKDYLIRFKNSDLFSQFQFAQEDGIDIYQLDLFRNKEDVVDICIKIIEEIYQKELYEIEIEPFLI